MLFIARSTGVHCPESSDESIDESLEPLLALLPPGNNETGVAEVAA